MESNLKLKVSRMFSSSFGSCRPKNITDISETPIFVNRNCQDFRKIIKPYPSICKLKLLELIEIEKISGFQALGRKKITEKQSCFVTNETEGRTSPPASPSSPLNFFSNSQYFETRERKKKPHKLIHKPKKKMTSRLSFSSDNGGGWFSSEEEEDDETETFFSSRSFSSDSSKSLRRKKTNSRRKRDKSRRRRDVSDNREMGLVETFAVVKSSRNPYSDFRTSMVEMIRENQIYEAMNLEKLLDCYLSLNSSHHHRVIIEAFTEIWDALFFIRS